MTNSKNFELHKFCDCCDTCKFCKNKIPEENEKFISWDKDMKSKYPERSRVDIIYQGDLIYLIEFKNWNWFKKTDYTKNDFQKDLYKKFNNSIDDFEEYTNKKYFNVAFFFAFNKEDIQYHIKKGTSITTNEFNRMMQYITASMKPVRGNIVFFDNCRNVFGML